MLFTRADKPANSPYFWTQLGQRNLLLVSNWQEGETCGVSKPMSFVEPFVDNTVEHIRAFIVTRQQDIALLHPLCPILGFVYHTESSAVSTIKAKSKA
jgi:hypothetical protein